MAAQSASAADLSRTRPPTVWEYQCLTSGCAEPGGLMGCLYVMFCPCLAAGWVSNIAGTNYIASVLCYIPCPCIVGCMNRGALREVIGVEGGQIQDLLYHLPICTCCALCQEINEVQFREGCNYGIKRGQPLAAAQASVTVNPSA